MKQSAATITPYRSPMRRLLPAWVLLVLMAALTAAGAAHAACVCSSGRMTNWYPGTAPIAVDGAVADWTGVIADPNNNICDGFPGSEMLVPPLTDRDAPIQSTGRDLEQFTYTYDSTYVYAFTKRYASDSNTDKFIYYADTNNDGSMQTGEPVIVVGWQGSNRSVSVYLGTYLSYYPATPSRPAGGDPMVCTAGYTAGQSCSGGFADGYHLPGSVTNLPAAGQPTYAGTWGSASGTEMEWRVSWSDLGIAPGTAFSFHVSSTNSQPGAGSFPAQTDDNMGGCGGGGGTTQYAGLSLTPDQTIILGAAQTYSTTHVLTNTGNEGDNFTLSYAVSGSNSPIPTVTYYYNGQAFTDTSTLGAGFVVAPGASITITTQFTFGSSPANKSYNVTTTAISKFNTLVSAKVVDSLVSQKAIVIHKQTTNGSYGSFSFGAGTNGLPASLTLTTSAGNNPAASPGYVITNLTKSSSITETVASGWRFVSAACAYFPSGFPVTDVTVVNNSGATPPTAVLTINSFAFGSDSLVDCTFTNERLPRIAVSKLLGGSRISDADQFTVQLKYGATVVGSATTGTGANVAAGTGTVSYVAAATGIAYTLDEVKSAGPTPAGAYAASLTCTNKGAAVAVPNALAQSFTPVAGDSYVCFITNTPPSLTVRKVSTGGTGVYSFSGTNGVAASFSLDTTASNPQIQSYVLSAVGTATTVTETVPAGWTLNGACVDGAGTPVPGVTLAGGTLTVPAAAVVAGANLVCTFVNTLKPNLVLTKTADDLDGVAPGQVVTYTVQMTNSAGAAAGVELTDTLSPYTAFAVDGFGAGIPFQFADGPSYGAPASGLTLGAPFFSRDNGATWQAYAPVPGGYDPLITNWRITMNGTMNGWSGAPPYPGFTVKYKVRVR